MRVRTAAIAALLLFVLVQVMPEAPAGAQAPPAAAGGHQFKTWTPADAASASQEAANQAAQPPGPGKAPVPDVQSATAFAIRVRQALPKVQAELGSAYVSAAIDPTVGNRLVVRVTASAAQITSPALAALEGGGGEVRVVEHQAPTSTTDDAFTQARAKVGTKAGGATITGVARDDFTGRVVVGVEGDVASAQRALGTDVDVREQKQPRATDGNIWGSNPAKDDTPIAGGESLIQTQVAPGSLCTTAFPATQGGAPVIVTAGHCIRGAPSSYWGLGVGSSTSQTVTSLIGVPGYYDYANLGIDAGVINIQNQNWNPRSRNCIVVENGSCRSIRFTSDPLVVGEPIAKSGSRTGDSFGAIGSLSWSGSFDGINLTNAISASACAWEGDSGGVLYRDNGDGTVEPIGITSGGSGCPGSSGVYTNWRSACPLLGIDVASCPTAQPQHVAVMSDNSRPMVITTMADRLVVREQQAGGSWSAQIQLGPLAPAGVRFTGKPATARNVSSTGVVEAGPRELVVASTSGLVYHAWWTGTGWSTWTAFPGFSVPGAGVAMAAKDNNGALEIFAVGGGGAVYHIWQTGQGTGWSNWESLGGPAMTVAVAKKKVNPTPSNQTLEIFAIDTLGRLMHNWQVSTGNGWSGWQLISGVTGWKPTVTAVRNNNELLEVFTIGSDGAVWHAWQAPGTGTGWTGFSQIYTNVFTTGLASVRNNGTGRPLEVFVTPPGGETTYHAWQNGSFPNGWWPWTSL